MSGICGIVRFDGDSRGLVEISRMTSAMAYRGPDGIGHWGDPSVALGCCLLSTTEEAKHESQPLQNSDASIVLVIDGTLWNAPELRSELRRAGIRLRTVADSELVLRAYEAWGRDCLARMDGDFAFAIYDRRRREVFCARDRIGMRPFYWHYSTALGFCFASEPEVLLALSSMPRRLNEARIADAIVDVLEGYDNTSSFYLDIMRLPPAHQLIAAPSGVKGERYWSYRPPDTLLLGSDAEYDEVFTSALTQSVRRRLRGGSKAGAMLSGGLDSGSIAAAAQGALSLNDLPSLRTVSAVGPDAHLCIETAGAYESARQLDVDAHFVDYSRLGAAAEASEEAFGPFDWHMSLIRMVYGAGRTAGLCAMLDGGAADLILHPGAYVTRYLQKGQVLHAWREAKARGRFWNQKSIEIGTQFIAEARAAWLPQNSATFFSGTKSSYVRPFSGLISQRLAEAVNLEERFQHAKGQSNQRFYPGSAEERARRVFAPLFVAGRERYERVASRAFIESRDPFVDITMINLCMSLPLDQIVRNGWPKFIMRRSMGELPVKVRWQAGRTHLGPKFTQAVMAANKTRILEVLNGSWIWVGDYFDKARLRYLFDSYQRGAHLCGADQEQLWKAFIITTWLERQIHVGRATHQNIAICGNRVRRTTLSMCNDSLAHSSNMHGDAQPCPHL